jgi:uncharacterized membrane protein
MPKGPNVQKRLNRTVIFWALLALLAGGALAFYFGLTNGLNHPRVHDAFKDMELLGVGLMVVGMIIKVWSRYAKRP